MRYDLVIRNGVVIDGSGAAGASADVAIADGVIAALGRVPERGQQELDADGNIVCPGFIDGHTHMDAQVFWDPLGSSPCWHGVTTVVMGNCGFTLAPAKPTRAELVLRNLERSEDIPAIAMAEGIDWTWEHFSEYLDAVERLPKAINYAAYIGHSALRTWAMGERAFDEAANEDDLRLMESELRDAMASGAVGFSTSRSTVHETSDDRPIASRLAEWQEVMRLACAAGEFPSRVFELSLDMSAVSQHGSARQRQFFDQLMQVALEAKLLVMFGVVPSLHANELLRLIEESADAGAPMLGQTNSTGIWLLSSFLTRMPFDGLAGWREIRGLPLETQKRLLGDGDVRRRLVDEAHNGAYPRVIGAEAPRPDFATFRVFDDPLGANSSVGELASHLRRDPVEFVIDRALETDFTQLFAQPVVPWEARAEEAILRHPLTVMTFSDSGAHVSQQVSPVQTHLLGQWVRRRAAFSWEEAIRMITSVPASAWGLDTRGLVREGYVADLNVIDPSTVGPELPQVSRDLPGGATRFTQRASGVVATIVGGEVVFENGRHTGALPGTLIRRAP